MKQNRILRCCLVLTAAVAISGCSSHQPYDPIVVVPKASAGPPSNPRDTYEVHSGFWMNMNGHWVWAPTGASIPSPSDLIVTPDFSSPATEPLVPPTTEPISGAPVVTAPATPEPMAPTTPEVITPATEVVTPDPSVSTATTEQSTSPPVETPPVAPVPPPAETPIEEPTQPPVGGTQEP